MEMSVIEKNPPLILRPHQLRRIRKNGKFNKDSQAIKIIEG